MSSIFEHQDIAKLEYFYFYAFLKLGDMNISLFL